MITHPLALAVAGELEDSHTYFLEPRGKRRVRVFAVVAKHKRGPALERARQRLALVGFCPRWATSRKHKPCLEVWA